MRCASLIVPRPRRRPRNGVFRRRGRGRTRTIAHRLELRIVSTASGQKELPQPVRSQEESPDRSSQHRREHQPLQQTRPGQPGEGRVASAGNRLSRGGPRTRRGHKRSAAQSHLRRFKRHGHPIASDRRNHRERNRRGSILRFRSGARGFNERPAIEQKNFTERAGQSFAQRRARLARSSSKPGCLSPCTRAKKSGTHSLRRR